MFSGILSGVPSEILKEFLGKISLETFVEFLGEILELSLEERDNGTPFKRNPGRNSSRDLAVTSKKYSAINANRNSTKSLQQ